MLEIKVSNKKKLGNSQYLFDDSRSDDIDKLQDVRN